MCKQIIIGRFDFNPRSREGSDATSGTRCNLGCISIHAPARGATTTAYFMCCLPLYFNPRSREGSDDVALAIHTSDIDFNPRSREGSDASLA